MQQHKNAGNFANDKKRAAECGRIGGQRSKGGGRANKKKPVDKKSK